MTWRLEAWNTAYALPERAVQGGDPEAGGDRAWAREVRADFEGDWGPRRPTPLDPACWPRLLFVDGRQQVEALLADEAGRPALLATVVAGAVVRDGGGIRPAGEPLKRHLLLHGGERGADVALPEGLRHYVPLGFPHADVAQLRHRLTEAMRRLEVALVNRLAEAGEEGLTVLDGQLFPGEAPFRRPGQVLGYTKTQAASYLDPSRQALLGRLEPGERTPVFFLRGLARCRPLDVFSWYLRLPLRPARPYHPSAALLRVETPAADAVQAVALADLSVSVFCALASSPARDPRAPQNLIPVGGLELWLGRYLGQPEVVRRQIARALFG